jgi:hypothetical protein
LLPDLRVRHCQHCVIQVSTSPLNISKQQHRLQEHSLPNFLSVTANHRQIHDLELGLLNTTLDISGRLVPFIGAARMATTEAGRITERSKDEGHTKQWRPIFFTKRPFKDIPFFEAYETIEGFQRDYGALATFLDDDESSVPSWEMTIIARFLKIKYPENGPPRTLARARLDDREHGSDKPRQNSEWLTPDQLQDALSLPVFCSTPSPSSSDIPSDSTPSSYQMPIVV